MNHPVLPDYENCVANLPNSILKYFGAEPAGSSSKLLDKYLKEDYKNVVFKKLVCNVNDAFFVKYLWIVAANHVYNAKYPGLECRPYGFYENA